MSQKTKKISLELTEKALKNLNKISNSDRITAIGAVVNDYLENINYQNLQRKPKRRFFDLLFIKKSNLWLLTQYSLNNVNRSPGDDIKPCIDWFKNYNQITEEEIENVYNQYKHIAKYNKKN